MSILRTLIFGIVAFFVFALLAYGVAALLRTTSTGRPTMPIGEALVALLVGALGAAWVMYSDRRSQRRERLAELDAVERGDVRRL